MRLHLALLAGSVLVLGAPAARAATLVSTGVSFDNGIFADSASTTSQQAGSELIHAVASATQDENLQESSSTSEGAGSLCAAGGLTCGAPIEFIGDIQAGAYGAAQADGTGGVLQVAAKSFGGPDPSGTAQARLDDTLTFTGAPVVHLDLDIGSFGLYELLGHPQGDLPDFGDDEALLLLAVSVSGFVIAEFRAFEDVAGCNSPDPDCSLAEVILLKGFELHRVDAVGGEFELVDSGGAVPSSYAFDVDLGVVQCGAGPCSTFDLRIELSVLAQSHGDANGTRAYADQSLYTAIASGTFTSASGYQYLGRSSVPEPSAPLFLALAAAVTLLGNGERRRARR